MKLKFKTANHPKPIEMDTKGTPEEMAKITPGSLDASKICREFQVSGEPVSETGNLFFCVNKAKMVQVLWMHLTIPEFVELISFPNEGKIKDPHKDKVTVYRDDEKIVVDVDAIMYVFLLRSRKTKARLIADVHVETIEDPKLLVTELCDAVLEQVQSTGQDLNFEVA